MLCRSRLAGIDSVERGAFGNISQVVLGVRINESNVAARDGVILAFVAS